MGSSREAAEGYAAEGVQQGVQSHLKKKSTRSSKSFISTLSPNFFLNLTRASHSNHCLLTAIQGYHAFPTAQNTH